MLQVCTDLEQSKRQDFYFGAKLVRGAYIEQERARANALGYSDPINPSYEATTDMYHKTFTECLRRIKVKYLFFFVIFICRCNATDYFCDNISCFVVFIFQLFKDQGGDAKKIGIMVASHNEDTVRFAIEKMKEIGISPEDKVICFGQLLGMCDYITFPLGKLLRLIENLHFFSFLLHKFR